MVKGKSPLTSEPKASATNKSKRNKEKAETRLTCIGFVLVYLPPPHRQWYTFRIVLDKSQLNPVSPPSDLRDKGDDESR